MTFTTTVRSHDVKTSVIELVGQLSASSADELRDAIAEALKGEQNHVILDFTDIDFVDSSGLGAVIGGLKAARLAGGDLRLVAPGPQVTMILKLTNLDQILPPYPTVEAAASSASS